MANMSHNTPFGISTEHNRIIHYRKPSPSGTKAKSGILERYTYKSDKGELLPSTSFEIMNKSGVNRTNSVNSVNMGAKLNMCGLPGNIVQKRSLPFQMSKHNPNRVLFKRKHTKSFMVQNTVRTEHCDSTTDVDVIKNNELEVGKGSDSDDFEVRYSPSHFTDHSYTFRRQTPQIEDSDSDCQIVEVKTPTVKRRFGHELNSKQKVEWMIIAEQKNKYIDPVHVISDSESDEGSSANVQINRLTSSDLPSDKTVKNVEVVDGFDNSDYNKRVTPPNSDVEDCLLDIKIDESQQEPSVYEISDGIKIVLPPKSTAKSQSPVINKMCLSPQRTELDCEQVKPRFEILSNVIVKPNISDIFSGKTYESDDNAAVSSSENHFAKPEIKQEEQNAGQKMNERLGEPTSPCASKLQKCDTGLSPESMKSEFYSYLKINTNPSAQKAETTMQNRRSIRVRNLITQHEKQKEKNEVKTEEERKAQKINEVRKRFLKYSKSRVQFPSPVAQCNVVTDFESSIEHFFAQEGIKNPTESSDRLSADHKLSDSFLLGMPVKNKDNSLRFRDKYNYKRKIMYKKLLLKKKNEEDKNVIQKNKENLFFKHKTLLKSKVPLKNFKANRVLRNRRITRHTLASDNYQTLTRKLLKSQKATMKSKSRKKELKSVPPELVNLENISDQPSISKVPSLEQLNEISQISIEKMDEILNKDDGVKSSVSEYSYQDKYDKLDEPSSSFHLDEQSNSSCLNPLDKFDLLTKNYMAENSIYQNDYCMDSSASINNGGNSFSMQESLSSLQDNLDACSSSVTSDDETRSSEESRKTSPTENCLGFQPDEKINKIRKNIQNVLLNMDSKPIVLIPREEMVQANNKGKLIHRDSVNSNETDLNQGSVSRCQTPIFESEDEDVIQSDEHITSMYSDREQCISPEIVNSETIKRDTKNYIPLNPNIKTKPFHHSLLLTPTKRRSNESLNRVDPLFASGSVLFLSDSSDSEISQPSGVSHKPLRKRSRTHEIDIQKNNGPVFNAYYVNCTLIIVQELVISFWKQTPLGNVLGAQNMWYSIGNIKRLMLERGCTNRRSSEMVLHVDSSVAYIELWTKELQSDYRERPVADIFATVYFHRGHGAPDKKVLQLENIKGYGNDVKFVVMKNSKEIVVSWYDTCSKPTKSILRSYQLASDFQTICSIKEMESVQHYVLSLHNIGNCDTLVLGAGSDQISVWNLTHGWLSNTVNFSMEPTLQIHSMCLWAHCETGYLFLLQQIGRGILRLIAVNGASNQWKQLQIYHVPECYESLLGVTIESGILMTCYTNGFLCYDMQSGELLADTETPINRIILPSDKFLVSIDDYKVSVKHVMVYVLEN